MNIVKGTQSCTVLENLDLNPCKISADALFSHTFVVLLQTADKLAYPNLKIRKGEAKNFLGKLAKPA